MGKGILIDNTTRQIIYNIKDKKKKEKKRERSSSSSEEDGNAKKSTAALCYFYAQGRCRNGENCFYSHEQS